jgi:DNA-binding PadR family transcriptional regulator
MSPRRRYYHPPTAAVFAVLGAEENRVWSVADLAKETGLSYGSVYSILQRIWSQGQVYRQAIAGGFGDARLYFDLTDRGWRARDQVLSFMPDPVRALRGLAVKEEDDTANSTVESVGTDHAKPYGERSPTRLHITADSGGPRSSKSRRGHRGAGSRIRASQRGDRRARRNG